MAKSPRNAFQLQFAPALIKEIAARYVDEDDTEALQAGRCIASGDYSRAHLEAIFRWKTGGRGISRLRPNSDIEIRDALRLAVSAQTERAAVSVLCGLWGVKIPVASAILTAVDPGRYTIIDFRALEAIGAKNSCHTVDSYLAYLDECRDLARQNTVGLRELDRALWQWSKEASQKSLP
jgi:hypothetical protein